jgi:DNA repair ATPase RecN
MSDEEHLDELHTRMEKLAEAFRSSSVNLDNIAAKLDMARHDAVDDLMEEIEFFLRDINDNAN